MAGGSGVKGGPGRFTIVSGSHRGSPGGGRRRGEAAAAASAPFAPPDRGRCALRQARASGSRRREGRRRCSRRRHHVLPRQEEHPADHGESPRRRLPPSLPGCTAGGAPRIPAGFPGRVPGEGQGPKSGGWRAAVSPAGAAGATQTERPWGLGKTKQRGNPNSGAENFGLFRLLSHRPVVPEERRAQGPPRIPAPPGVSACAAPGARRAFLFKVAFGEMGYGKMTPFSRGPWQRDHISLPDPAPWLCPRLKGGGCLDCPSSPCPLLACLHPDIYFSASFSGLDS